MTTNIIKEQGHTFKQSMLNTLLLNLKTTVPRFQKEHQKTAKTAPNQHQICCRKPTSIQHKISKK